MTDWTPTSWQAHTALQQPVYPDPVALDDAASTLSELPPLVSSWEIEALKSKLAEASEGRRFLLQGGDCAESFAGCTSPLIASTLKILLQMSLVLIHGMSCPIIRVGRFAGQYAKPRTENTETRDGVELPSFRGDNVNRIDFTPEDRTPDPALLVRGYERAAMTLNFIRSLVDGGFADLHHPEYWNLDFVQHSQNALAYQDMISSIGKSIRFTETISSSRAGQFSRVDFYASHEGLVLHGEQAQTRTVPHRSGWYNLSTHLPWIGLRTSDADGAHVEFFRGIRNPIGIKIGPGNTPENLARLLDILHPDNEPGRLVLIHRFGTEDIARELPPYLRTVKASGKTVLWSCDPMHGNTKTTLDGIKTRRFEHILSEVEQAIDIHTGEGTILGGIHLELTGENVTECTGGARGLSDDDLEQRYTSQVDPRLNYEQALEIAFMISDRLAVHSGSR